MTARKYAKKVGFELTGKLTREEIEITDYEHGKPVPMTIVIWTDEDGYAVTKNEATGKWLLITPMGYEY